MSASADKAAIEAPVGASGIGFIAVALQLALLAWLLSRFNLETRAFQDVMWIAVAGFMVHHWLPAKWRPRFFLALSVIAITYVLGLVQLQWQPGAALARAAPLFAIGLGLIGLCHLPVRFGIRVALLVLAGIGLAALRERWGALFGGDLDPNWIWPVLGSMFMFRLMVYVYDLQHDKGPAQPTRALSYFFLLPNVCFPLFPVVDYKTFGRSYFNEPEFAIYQRGLAWITRGIVHLLLWRIVYYEFHIDPSRVASGAELTQYIVANVAIYLRVSGQFHCAVGLLLLFGFNLPETNRRYFLASGFTDYYRRVNIYWRDFIMKVFFYPAAFRLKAWGPLWSMVAATALAFVVTWLLHSYQTFWIRGYFPVSARDALFWGSLGALVILNSVYEMKRGRKRTLQAGAESWKDRVSLGLRTAGTFLVLALLWSLWGCESVEQWLALWQFANRDTLLWGAATLAVVFGAALALETSSSRRPAVSPGFSVRMAVLTCILPAAVLLALSVQRWHVHLGPQPVALLALLFETRPNRSDEENMVRGYYEDLQAVNPALEWGGTVRPAGWDMLEKSAIYREVDDYRLYELAPSSRVMLNGHPLSTNRWGMRDRDYELAKPPGTYRIALLGSSVVMGLNVDDGEPFEAVVEDRLNREWAGRPHARYEILNFAVNGYNPPAQVLVLEKALAFKPDAVVLVIHSADAYFTVQRLAKSLRRGIEPPDELFRQLARQAKVDGATSELSAEKRLRPHWPRLVEWAYQRIAARCREAGIEALVVYLPGAAETNFYKKDGERMMELARKAGFTIVNLDGTYGAADPETLKAAPWDAHPNALGHNLIAQGLFAALTAEGAPLGTGGGARKSPNR